MTKATNPIDFSKEIEISDLSEKSVTDFSNMLKGQALERALMIKDVCRTIASLVIGLSKKLSVV